MKWYDWIIAGLIEFLVVLFFLPLIIFIEWTDIMGRIKRKKEIFEQEVRTQIKFRE